MPPQPPTPPGRSSPDAAAGLNPAQQSAVRHLDGPCLVIAGAGSGKTRVITTKMVHLIDSGLEPRTIAAITFTNKAAREMAERFASLCKLPARRAPLISTFHSLGLTMLRESGRAVGLKTNFSIFDTDDCSNLLAQLLASTDRKLVRQTLSQISLWKNANLAPTEALAGARGEHLIRCARVYEEYQSTLEGYQATDFDDLIRLPLRMMLENEEAARTWRARLRYFLVDEYQDTNATQYALLRELVRGRDAFTAVGDDDQSIYGWRGATLENLRRLETDFPRLRIIKLEQNYRSSRSILAAANALITVNPKLHPKTLWSALGEGDPPRIIPCDDDQHEADSIATRLTTTRFEKRGNWSDFAVLYRSNHQARIIEQALRRENIPYRISGGQSFFERAEIRDLCAYLRLLANDDDDPAFIRAATTPRRGIGAQTLKILGTYAGTRNTSLMSAAFELGLEQQLSERQLTPLRNFCEWVQGFAWRSAREPAPGLLAELIEGIGYREHLESQGDERDATRRWQQVEDFTGWVTRRTEDQTLTLNELAQRIAIITRLESREDHADEVALSTIHAAKGLEYPHVFLIGLEEGLLPHTGRDDEEGGGTPEEAVSALESRIEEERRLMYVAVTRAKRSLTITWCRQRRRGKGLADCQPSRFLGEMQLAPQDPGAPLQGSEAKNRLAALRARIRPSQA